MNMQPSAWLFGFLKGIERFRPTAYKPTPNDVWTAGYGHTKGVTATTTCSMAQGDAWLHTDTMDAVNEVNTHVKVPLQQYQFDALCSICFNIGDGDFAGSTLLAKLNAGDYAGAAAEFPKWRFQKHVPLAGLAVRRAEEQAHFLGH